MNLSQRLKQAREAKGLTQYKLAKISGVTQQSISNIERGRSKGTVQLVTLANALNVSPTWLETGKEENRDTYYNFSDVDTDVVCEEPSGRYKQPINKELQEVVEYALSNQLKQHYEGLTVAEQVSLVFELYTSVFNDKALLDAAKNMQPSTLLKMVNN